MQKREYLTVKEAADILGISRIAVFKKIKTGVLPAEKIGRNYAVPKSELKDFIPSKLSEDLKGRIAEGVERVVREYKETLVRLGKEEK